MTRTSAGGGRASAAGGKIPVVGLRDRDGRIKSLMVPDLSQSSFHGVIRRFVLSGSVIYSDDWSGYGGLTAYGYPHEILNRQEGFRRDHLESYWAHTRPDAKPDTTGPVMACPKRSWRGTTSASTIATTWTSLTWFSGFLCRVIRP